MYLQVSATPVESLSPLSPIICGIFDIFHRYGTLIPLSPCDWRGLKSQLRACAALHLISIHRLALVLAYTAAFTLPALTANSLVLAYFAASTLHALTYTY